MELMELENIVANTVYLKAREGGPEGSKGRRWAGHCTFVLQYRCTAVHLYCSTGVVNSEYLSKTLRI